MLSAWEDNEPAEKLLIPIHEAEWDDELESGWKLYSSKRSREDFGTYRVESHNLQLQSNFFLSCERFRIQAAMAETHPKLLLCKALSSSIRLSMNWQNLAI